MAAGSLSLGVGFKMKEPCQFSIRFKQAAQGVSAQLPAPASRLPLAARLSDTMDSDSSELINPSKLSYVRCLGHGDSSQQ